MRFETIKETVLIVDSTQSVLRRGRVGLREMIECTRVNKEMCASMGESEQHSVGWSFQTDICRCDMATRQFGKFFQQPIIFNETMTIDLRPTDLQTYDPPI